MSGAGRCRAKLMTRLINHETPGQSSPSSPAAANGIGRALCRRFAAESARGVVVADLDGAGALQVARGNRRIGGHGRYQPSRPAFPGSSRSATAPYGAIDLFCSNAGSHRGRRRTRPKPSGKRTRTLT